MSDEHSILVDNTTIDSAARVLTEAETSRRADKGWCLRDISDLACLSTVLDALIYFDDVFFLPNTLMETTEHIGSDEANAVQAQLRRHMKPLPLSEDDANEIRIHTDSVADNLYDEMASKGAFKVYPLSRAKLTFGSQTRSADQVIDASQESQRLNFKRAILYSVASKYKRKDEFPGLCTWLAPDRLLTAQRFDADVENFIADRTGFNDVVGRSKYWVAIAPSLLYLLTNADRQKASNFCDYFVTQVDELRSSDLAKLRDLFHSSLNSPVTADGLKEWAKSPRVPELVTDAVGLVPVVGSFASFTLKWAGDKLLYYLGCMINYNDDSRSFLRNVVNDIRLLESDAYTEAVLRHFAGGQQYVSYHAYNLDYCAKAFRAFLAGRKEWEGDEVQVDDCLWR